MPYLNTTSQANLPQILNLGPDHSRTPRGPHRDIRRIQRPRRGRRNGTPDGFSGPEGVAARPLSFFPWNRGSLARNSSAKSAREGRRPVF